MNSTEKIRLLVIPERFPESDHDIGGVYTLDYISSVLPFCEVDVFYARLSGKGENISFDDPRGFRMHHYTLLRGQPDMLKKLLYLRWFTKALKVAKMKGPFDLIHAHGALFHGNLAVQLGKHWKIPVIVSVHTGPFQVITSNPFYRRLALRSLSLADLTLAVSEHLAADILASGIKCRKLMVSGNPVNDRVFRPVPGKKIHKQMLFVSRLDEFKGGMRTLRAFHSVLGKLPGWRLLIAGVGEELQPIEQYVDKHGLEASVRVVGTLSKKGLQRTFAESDFLVFPSRHETFGLIAQEALCAGLPVIYPNSTAPAQLIRPASGIAVYPDDEQAIAEAMLQMADKHHTYNSEEISADVTGRFGLEAFGNQMIGHYRQVMESCAE